MARRERLRFRPGDIVFARWNGADEFEVMEESMSAGCFPHYKCKIWGGKNYDYWVMPQVLLSKNSIIAETKDCNRKQLSSLN